MKPWLWLCVVLATSGCAMEPLTPQQQEYMRQWSLEQQRHNNQTQRDAWNSMKPVQTAPLQAPTRVAPIMETGQIASWTGKSQPAQSVTGVQGFNCEYQFNGQRFWQMHEGACPSSVWVR